MAIRVGSQDCQGYKNHNFHNICPNRAKEDSIGIYKEENVDGVVA